MVGRSMVGDELEEGGGWQHLDVCMRFVIISARAAHIASVEIGGRVSQLPRFVFCVRFPYSSTVHSSTGCPATVGNA